MFYDKVSQQQLSKILKLECIEIPINSVFVSHGYIQHGGAGWKGCHSLRYHMYFVPVNYRLPDGIHLTTRDLP